MKIYFSVKFSKKTHFFKLRPLLISFFIHNKIYQSFFSSLSWKTHECLSGKQFSCQKRKKIRSHDKKLFFHSTIKWKANQLRITKSGKEERRQRKGERGRRQNMTGNWTHFQFEVLMNELFTWKAELKSFLRKKGRKKMIIHFHAYHERDMTELLNCKKKCIKRKKLNNLLNVDVEEKSKERKREEKNAFNGHVRLLMSVDGYICVIIRLLKEWFFSLKSETSNMKLKNCKE